MRTRALSEGSRQTQWQAPGLSREDLRMRNPLALPLLLVLASSGCSLIGMKRVGYRAALGGDPDCTSHRGLVVADAVAGGAWAAGAAYAATNPPGLVDQTGKNNSASMLVTAGLMTVMMGTSAITGIVWSGDCREALAKWEPERLRIQQALAADYARKRDEVIRKRAVMPETANLMIRNAYTETIFKISLAAPETEERAKDVLAPRINGSDVRSFDGAISGRPGQKILIGVASLSLGTFHDLGVFETEIQPGGTFEILYDWDAALAVFRARGGWSGAEPRKPTARR